MSDKSTSDVYHAYKVSHKCIKNVKVVYKTFSNRQTNHPYSDSYVSSSFTGLKKKTLYWFLNFHVKQLLCLWNPNFQQGHLDPGQGHINVIWVCLQQRIWTAKMSTVPYIGNENHRQGSEFVDSDVVW